MKRKLLVCLLAGLLIGVSLVPAAAGRPPEPRDAELLSRLGWTEARRQADPAGFFDAAIARLKCEATEVTAARESLAQDIGRQTGAIDAKVGLWRKAAHVATEFRDAYQLAARTNQWPVTVCGREYTEERLASQVSMLMKEAEALADCVAKLKQVRERTETRLEELTARTQVVDSQISMCMTKFELWKASRLEAYGNELLVLLDRLIIKRRPLTFDTAERSEDGFAFIPADTVESHRDGESLVHYLSHGTAGNKPQVQSTIGKSGQPKKSMFQQY